jgi:hypothetical protein
MTEQSSKGTALITTKVTSVASADYIGETRTRDDQSGRHDQLPLKTNPT